MSRLFLLCGLFGSLLVSRSIVAQDAGGYGPVVPRVPQVRRLPPVDGYASAEYMTFPSADPVEIVPVEIVPPGEIVPVETDVVEVKPQCKPAPDPWSGNFELGLDGSEGNSPRLNFRFGFEAKRKTAEDVLSLDLDYHRNTNDSLTTAHRTFLDWRYERLFKESAWTWFAHGTVDYDEFQAFDVRVAIDSGLGYQFIDTDHTSFLGRLGGGWSREIGGPDDDYVPEAAFGMDFERQVTKRQKLAATVDYTPDVTDMADFRLKSKASWEVLLDGDTNLSLKMSVLDRYDSTPHGAKANDVDYSVTLLWNF
jgi:putative salt-induced outer membrane protein YdiY